MPPAGLGGGCGYPDGMVESPRRRPLAVALIVVLVVGLVALVAATAVGLLLVAGSHRTSVSSTAGRIVVVDADGLIRTMDPLGGSERRYALTGRAAQFPAWSPDGGRLAVVGGPGLFVLDDNASGPPPETIPSPIYQSDEEPPFYLYWSPQGDQVTFLTSEPDGLALRAAAADGSNAGGIVRRGAPMYWAWTAADRMLVHAGGDGPNAFVGEVGLDGSEARRAAVVPGLFQAPAVSSDGLRRAYVASTDEPEPDIRSAVILVEDGHDGSVRRVAVLGPTALGWGPDQGSLAFIAPRERTRLPIGPLDLLDTSSSRPRTLLDGEVLAFFWSPDGASIAALMLATDQPREVASVRAMPPLPDAPIAADSGVTLRLKVVAADDGSVRIDRPVRLSETFVGQLMPYFDQYALSHRLWSPDSADLVLPLVGDDGLTHITIVPAAGDEPRVVADGEIAFWAP
jgi:TolB protein